MRLGLWLDDGTGKPGALLLDAGQVAGDSVATPAVTGLSVAITAGSIVWMGVVVQSVVTTQPTIRTAATPNYPIFSSTAAGVASTDPTGISSGGFSGALTNISSVNSSTIAPRVLFHVV